MSACLLGACERHAQQKFIVEWSLNQDVTAFTQASSAKPLQLYRISELRRSEDSPEYAAFLANLPRLPSVDRAIVYYEVSNNDSLYLFAVAFERDDVCHLIVTDLNGTRQSTCQRLPRLRSTVVQDPRSITDPVVVGATEIDTANARRRLFTILPPGEVTGAPANGDLIDKISRVFGA